MIYWLVMSDFRIESGCHEKAFQYYWDSESATINSKLRLKAIVWVLRWGLSGNAMSWSCSVSPTPYPLMPKDLYVESDQGEK